MEDGDSTEQESRLCGSAFAKACAKVGYGAHGRREEKVADGIGGKAVRRGSAGS